MIDDDIFNGSVKPDIIPMNWQGRPLKKGKRGWCWYNPDNDLDAIFLYKDSTSVVVVKDGLCIDRNNKPIPESSMPDD